MKKISIILACVLALTLSLCAISAQAAGGGYVYKDVNDKTLTTISSNAPKDINVKFVSGGSGVNVGVQWDNGTYDGLYHLSAGSSRTFRAPAGATRGTVYAFAASGSFSATFYVSYGN